MSFHTKRLIKALTITCALALASSAGAQPVNPRQEGPNWKADGLCPNWTVAVRDNKHLVIKCPQPAPAGAEIGPDGRWVWLTILDIRIWCPKPKQLYARRSSATLGLTLSCK